MHNTVTIIPSRLEEVMQLDISEGSHSYLEEGLCVMEAVSYVAGEYWGDNPRCACPVVANFLRSWNDALPDVSRTELLRPLIPRLVGTKSTPAVELRRSFMAADWLVRDHTPAWLRLAGLSQHANALSGLPEISSVTQVPGVTPAIEAARRDASAVWRAIWDDGAWGAAAWDATLEDAVRSCVIDAAAVDAARDAARGAARDSPWDVAWAAAMGAIRSCVIDAARSLAWDAALDSDARDSSWEAVDCKASRDAAVNKKLAPTVCELQASAIALIERMIEVKA